MSDLPPASQFAPQFVKGHCTFELDGHRLRFENKNVSLYGITGLFWKPLSSQDHFGIPVLVTIETVTTEPARLKIRARLTRERTPGREYMGIRFETDDLAHRKLQEQIRRFGSSPTEYKRQYPRIPSRLGIEMFPLRAVLKKPQSMALDVLDLSPKGVLLTTENPTSSKLQPGTPVEVTLEPRGWFPHAITLHGQICRVTDDTLPNGNLSRNLGIRFDRADDFSRKAFGDMLKAILVRLKDRVKPK